MKADRTCCRELKPPYGTDFSSRHAERAICYRSSVRPPVCPSVVTHTLSRSLLAVDWQYNKRIRSADLGGLNGRRWTRKNVEDCLERRGRTEKSDTLHDFLVCARQTSNHFKYPLRFTGFHTISSVRLWPVNTEKYGGERVNDNDWIWGDPQPMSELGERRNAFRSQPQRKRISCISGWVLRFYIIFIMPELQWVHSAADDRRST